MHTHKKTFSTRNKTAALASAALALTLSLTGATGAYAAVAPRSDSTPMVSGIRVAAAVGDLDPRLASATDFELTMLFLTGHGALADAHPELVTEFGMGVSPIEKVDQMVPVAEQFLAAYPATWAPAVRSADPVLRDQGVDGFMTAFMDYVGHYCTPSCGA